jgi:serine/threonine protein kinase
MFVLLQRHCHHQSCSYRYKAGFHRPGALDAFLLSLNLPLLVSRKVLFPVNSSLVFNNNKKNLFAGNLQSLLLNKSIPLGWKFRVRMAKEAASALNYLHEHDVVHRDIKVYFSAQIFFIYFFPPTLFVLTIVRCERECTNDRPRIS